ncbi:nucleotidyltransferase substrate binding protein [bacterium]|nr:nucleotidyltransferase substrate binding protein [bacterium]
MLDLSSLQKSVEALERSIDAAREGMDSFGEDLRMTVRAGVIQNFEVAYEQCWKFIQRWLQVNRVPEEAGLPRTRKELFRLAAREGLIDDPRPWFEYGEARNLTSHTYDQAQAELVYAAAGRFVPEAKALLARLEALND